MAKRLIDIDEEALAAAQAALGTATMKDTVNEALRRAGPDDDRHISRALARLGRPRPDRDDAWR